MARDTGENAQALRKILDMTRMMGIILLLLHYYYYHYNSFKSWGFFSGFSDKLLVNIERTGLFDSFHYSKLFALLFLTVSLLGTRGKKSDKLDKRTGFAYLLTGLLLYFISVLCLWMPVSEVGKSIAYFILTGLGFILYQTGGTLLTRIIKDKLKDDIFNEINESFPQEERLLDDEYSVNLPARYKLKGKYRYSYLNFINIFRAVLLMGNPGSGKSFFVIRHFITQTSEKGFAQFIFDFKYPDLSLIAYNSWLKNKHRYRVPPSFYAINFDDLSRSARCNPLDPRQLHDITDAMESARTILLGLNREWIKKQGDFFVESPINLVTAIIWYLRKFDDGAYCTLPHVIEFLQLEYDYLFTLLRCEKEIEVLINPFINAYVADVMEQLEGQISSAKITLSRLVSPSLYYVLTGNDFTLDIANPKAPKIVCIGSNPMKSQTYGAVISLYVNRLLKLVNQKDMLKNCLIFDEFPTVYVSGTSTHIAVARSAKSAMVLGIQDLSQLKRDYSREEADVIFGIVGNVISGQVTAETAKLLSERIGKIMQDRQSLSISDDTSISKSKQLESAVPASKISSLSSGEFVGVVADNPDNKIALKAFNCEILNDIDAIQAEEKAYKEIPVVRKIDQEMVDRNFLQVKEDILMIVHRELTRLDRDPKLKHLIITKNKDI